MWERLCAQHLQSLIEYQHALRQRFYTYDYQSDNDILTHITTIETLAAQSKDAGAVMDLIKVMAKIVSTLSSTYENFKSVLLNVKAGDKTIQLLTS